MEKGQVNEEGPKVITMEPVEIGAAEAQVLDRIWEWHENSTNTRVVLGCPLRK